MTIYNISHFVKYGRRPHSLVAELRAAPLTLLSLEVQERCIELLQEVMLFLEDGQVDLARAGRGGGDVLVRVYLRLKVRVDLHLGRVQVRARVRVIVRLRIRARVLRSPP